MRIFTLTAILSQEEFDALSKPLKGKRGGGFQELIRSLKRSLDPESRVLILDRDKISRIQKYYKKYGYGGFQDRLPALAKALTDLQE